MIKKIFDAFTCRKIINLYQTSFKKNVLICYLPAPMRGFVRGGHTNQLEAVAISEVFRDLGYNVDVVHVYCDNLSGLKNEYDVVFGELDSFQLAISKYSEALKILYSTTLEPSTQNLLAEERYFEAKRIFPEIEKDSVRLHKENYLNIQYQVDHVIALGNPHTLSYFKIDKNRVHSFFPTGYVVKCDERLKSRNSFVWFAGAGSVHKGLDVVIDVFSSRNDVKVHLVGPYRLESFYKHETNLFKRDNIIDHGFLKINSSKLSNIFAECNFVLQPSCSEGVSTSVLTALRSSVAVPIISLNCGLSDDFDALIVNSINKHSLNKIIDKALSLNDEEIAKSQKKNFFLANQYNLLNFKSTLFDMIRKITL